MKKVCAVVFAVTFCLATQGLGQESTGSEGSKSADEVAKELANPNTSLASLTFKNQYRWYTGDLPGADDQDAVDVVSPGHRSFPTGPLSGSPA